MGLGFRDSIPNNGESNGQQHGNDMGTRITWRLIGFHVS